MKFLIYSFALLTFLFSCANKKTQEQKSNSKESGGLLVEAYNNGAWEKILSICNTLYDETASKTLLSFILKHCCYW